MTSSNRLLYVLTYSCVNYNAGGAWTYTLIHSHPESVIKEITKMHKEICRDMRLLFSTDFFKNDDEYDPNKITCKKCEFTKIKNKDFLHSRKHCKECGCNESMIIDKCVCVYLYDINVDYYHRCSDDVNLAHQNVFVKDVVLIFIILPMFC